MTTNQTTWDYGCISCGKQGQPPFATLHHVDGSTVKACRKCAGQRDQTRYPRVTYDA